MTATITQTLLDGNTANLTADDIKIILAEATQAAQNSALKHLQEHGENAYCGFAWLSIYGIKGNTKMGRAFKAAGIDKAYDGSHQVWNPSGLGTQCMWTKEVGAQAAADVFTKYGFRAYAGSRAD